ncbi:MAG: hypothetical protein JXA33_22105 [Anaerolineae bacterium]|nr:hypothetical protein [Anaerolineae bacterium]
MPITYTNRKNVTYTLCQGVTKTGKPRYFFAREPKDKPVEAIPEGYEIRESINGIVSLAKIRPKDILPEEVAAVEAVIQRHPLSRNYRMDVKPGRIDVYTLVGGDVNGRLAALDDIPAQIVDKIRADRERYGQYTAELRFILVDKEQRLFRAERMCYLSSVDGWRPLNNIGTAPIVHLAQRLIPALDTDAFFELY